MPADTGDAGAPQGLSWSWELDFGALIASLTDAGLDGAALLRPSRGDIASAVSRPPGGPAEAGTGCGHPADPGNLANHDDLDDHDDHDGAGDHDDVDDHDGADDHGGPRIPASALAGRVAERLAPGPDLWAWLAMAEAPNLDDAGLAAVAGSWR